MGMWRSCCTYAIRDLKEGAAKRDSMDRTSCLLIPARNDQSCLQHILQHTHSLPQLQTSKRGSTHRPSSLLMPAHNNQSCLQHILQHPHTICLGCKLPRGAVCTDPPPCLCQPAMINPACSILCSPHTICLSCKPPRGAVCTDAPPCLCQPAMINPACSILCSPHTLPQLQAASNAYRVLCAGPRLVLLHSAHCSQQDTHVMPCQT